MDKEKFRFSCTRANNWIYIYLSFYQIIVDRHRSSDKCGFNRMICFELYILLLEIVWRISTEINQIVITW